MSDPSHIAHPPLSSRDFVNICRKIRYRSCHGLDRARTHGSSEGIIPREIARARRTRSLRSVISLRGYCYDFHFITMSVFINNSINNNSLPLHSPVRP